MYIPWIILSIYIIKCMSIRQEGTIDDSKGTFERFLYNYLDVLAHGCKGKKLKRYTKVMYKELKKMGYTYTKELAKIFKELYRRYPEDINDEANAYLKEVDRKAYHRTEFYKSLNEAFHAMENIQFENYISDLDEYCRGTKLFMKEESHKLLYDVILNNVKKLGDRKLRTLRKKLKKAVKEYTKIEVAEFSKVYNLSLKPGNLKLPPEFFWLD